MTLWTRLAARHIGAALISVSLMGTAVAADFVAGSEDIPLMPGLVAVADAGMRFDSPAGRIVESVYEGGGDREAVSAFYAATLPELGWVADAPDQFRREGELLEIDYFGAGEALTVRFTLAPE